MAIAFDRIKEPEEFQLHRRIEKHRQREESKDRRGREAQMAELAERRNAKDGGRCSVSRQFEQEPRQRKSRVVDPNTAPSDRPRYPRNAQVREIRGPQWFSAARMTFG